MIEARKSSVWRATDGPYKTRSLGSCKCGQPSGARQLRDQTAQGPAEAPQQHAEAPSDQGTHSTGVRKGLGQLQNLRLTGLHVKIIETGPFEHRASYDQCSLAGELPSWVPHSLAHIRSSSDNPVAGASHGSIALFSYPSLSICCKIWNYMDFGLTG